MSNRSMSLALAAAIAACLAAQVAQAQPAPVQEIVVRAHSADAVARSQTVSYADLDLGHQAGARALLQRISGAAKLVCSPEPRELRDAPPYKACLRQAVDQAVDEVNSPRVSALHHSGS